MGGGEYSVPATRRLQGFSLDLRWFEFVLEDQKKWPSFPTWLHASEQASWYQEDQGRKLYFFKNWSRWRRVKWWIRRRRWKAVSILIIQISYFIYDYRKEIHAFEIDSEVKDGRLAIIYRGTHSKPQIWFQDLSCNWFFLANSFTDYFRLMIMHLGIPNWQYAFTKAGLDPQTLQWFRFLIPERLAIDIENRRN